jgi:hypothetical protein
MPSLYNVYRWHTRRRSLSRAVRVWQGPAKHGPGAIAAAHAVKPTLRGQPLFARPAHNDPYADDPKTLIEEDQQP